MSFLDDLISLGADLLTLRLYDVTVIVELGGVLVSKKTGKQLMTLRQVERMTK